MSIDDYRITYNLADWERIAKTSGELCAPIGAVRAVNALCDEIECQQAVIAALKAQQGEPVALLAYQSGYIRGHDDTVEGSYNSSCESTDECFLDAGFSSAPTIPEGWQPIETAPKDETRVLVVVRGFRVCIGWWFIEAGKWMTTDAAGAEDYESEYHPTHWRPLPATPKEKTE